MCWHVCRQGSPRPCTPVGPSLLIFHVCGFMTCHKIQELLYIALGNDFRNQQCFYRDGLGAIEQETYDCGMLAENFSPLASLGAPVITAELFL